MVRQEAPRRRSGATELRSQRAGAGDREGQSVGAGAGRDRSGPGPASGTLQYCLEEVILKFTLCFSCRLVGERFCENLMGKFKGRPANL